MKRNINLVELSSEHHDGLVIALRIKKALNNSIELQILVNYVNHLSDTLNNHFKQEEENLIQVKNISDKGEVLLERMVDEHKQFNELINKINLKGNSLNDDLSNFSDLLNDHIRFEERDLFPYVEQVLNDEQLEVIGNQLEKTHEPLDKNWGPKFWV